MSLHAFLSSFILFSETLVVEKQRFLSGHGSSLALATTLALELVGIIFICIVIYSFVNVFIRNMTKKVGAAEIFGYSISFV